MTKLELFLVLAVVYQVKHLVADYFLQGRYMLGKFKPGWDFLGPLLAHVWVHSAFTYVIVLSVSHDLSLASTLALFDAGVHFAMDRIKASPKYMGRWKPLTANEYIAAQTNASGKAPFYVPGAQEEARRRLKGNTYFWWALGFDQMVHHLTHYAIIWTLVRL